MDIWAMDALPDGLSLDLYTLVSQSTKLDKIKNFSHQVPDGGVIGCPPCPG